jgi:Zn-finger nucleic acid-binding protein
MSGNGEIDQCPFCNAVWGDCSHVQLLVALDAEASYHRTTQLYVCPSSNRQSDTSPEKPAAAGEPTQNVDQNKNSFRSWRVAR